MNRQVTHQKGFLPCFGAPKGYYQASIGVFSCWTLIQIAVQESKIDPEWIHAVYHVSSKDYQEIPNCPCGSCALWWLIPDDTSNFQAIRVLCVCLPPFHGYPTCFLLSFPSKVLHPIVSYQHSIQYSFRGPHLPHTERISYSHLVCCPLFLTAVCNLHSLGQKMCSNYLSPRPQITNKDSPEFWWNYAECAGFLLASIIWASPSTARTWHW